MEDDFFEELEDFREFLRGIGTVRTADPPLKANKEQPDHGYVRTLESIGRRICPEKPLCAKTVRKLIRLHGLPARKHKMGWLVGARDLDEWMERAFSAEEGF